MGARPSPPTTPSSHPRLPPRPSPLHAAPPSLAAARAWLRRALLPHRERASCHARAQAPCISPARADEPRAGARSSAPLSSPLAERLGLPGGWGKTLRDALGRSARAGFSRSSSLTGIIPQPCSLSSPPVRGKATYRGRIESKGGYLEERGKPSGRVGNAPPSAFVVCFRPALLPLPNR